MPKRNVFIKNIKLKNVYNKCYKNMVKITKNIYIKDDVWCLLTENLHGIKKIRKCIINWY